MPENGIGGIDFVICIIDAFDWLDAQVPIPYQIHVYPPEVLPCLDYF